MEPRLTDRLQQRAYFILLLLTAPLLSARLSAAEPGQEAPAGQTRAARPTTTRSANDTENQVVEDVSDRAREQAAEQASRRIVARLVRGPYLQCGTTNSMVVRWRTDKPGPSAVRFGLSVTNLKFTARTRGLHSEHVVVLTNLTPDMRYFYALGTNTVTGTNVQILTNTVGRTNVNAQARAGSSSRTNVTLTTNIVVLLADTNSFITAPLIGTNKPTRVWVLGDPGTRKPTQKAVVTGFSKFNGDHPIDLWLLLGDNAYDAGRDEEYQWSIFLAYPDLLRRSVLWPSLGNHDGDSASSPAQAGVYYDVFTLPTQGQAGGTMSGTEAYYSFDYANAHFIALDSYDSDRATNGLMARWLKADLAANTQTWAVAYWHHPPYSKGSHDTDDDRDGDSRSREMREGILPILESGGVDLVLCGHSHTYERTPLLDGHYRRSTNFSRAFVKDTGEGCEDTGGPYRKPTVGPGAHEGTVYVVAGSSGQNSGVKAVHPAMLFALNVPGSTVLDFNGPRLDVTFVDTNGTPRDRFAFTKGAAANAPTNSAPVPAWLVSLIESSSNSAQWCVLTNASSSERDSLLDLYKAAANTTLKSRLTWALAAIADARVAAQLTGVLTNKVRDRTISNDEEQLRLTTVRALGLVATRYEPTLDFLRKGLSADWWYFRTNYVAGRPLEQSAADLASSAIAAMALSGRTEAMSALLRASTNYVEFTSGEPEVLVRNYAREFEQATNDLAKAMQCDPITWRRRVLAAALSDTKPE